jgi:hypothetical protein
MSKTSLWRRLRRSPNTMKLKMRSESSVKIAAATMTGMIGMVDVAGVEVGAAEVEVASIAMVTATAIKTMLRPTIQLKRSPTIRSKSASR